MTIRLTLAAMLAAASLSPALADLEGDINSATPEAQEDCDALRESLASQRDDDTLNPQDMQELRDKGC